MCSCLVHDQHSQICIFSLVPNLSYCKRQNLRAASLGTRLILVLNLVPRLISQAFIACSMKSFHTASNKSLGDKSGNEANTSAHSCTSLTYRYCVVVHRHMLLNQMQAVHQQADFLSNNFLLLLSISDLIESFLETMHKTG